MLKKSTPAVIAIGFTLSFTFGVRADVIHSAGGGGASTPTAGPGDPIVGTFNLNNCIPFTCAESYGVNTYQQVYSSSAFSGITPFNEINFYLDLSFPGSLDTGTYKIYFSYTSAPVNGLSQTSPSDNIGADNTLFGIYMLPGGVAPTTLTFNGTTFDYNPAMGNLLMTIDTSGVVDGISLPAFYQADQTGTVMSRAIFGSLTVGSDNWALVTGFNRIPSTVPEPNSLGYSAGALLMVVCVQQGLRRIRKRFDLHGKTGRGSADLQ